MFPLAFEEGPDLGSRLAEWPVNHCVKVLALCGRMILKMSSRSMAELARLADACRQTGHELSGDHQWPPRQAC